MSQSRQAFVFVEALGAPRTLASTAFSIALARGLEVNGVTATIVGMVTLDSLWQPEPHVGETPVVAPCLGMDAEDQVGLAARLENVIVELLTDSSDPIFFFYSRSHWWLEIVIRIARSTQAKLVAMSTEAPSVALAERWEWDRLRKLTMGETDGVWAVSDALAQVWSQEGVSPARLFISPSLVRRESFLENSSPVSPSQAVYVGNLAHKEIEALLEISSLVIHRVPDFTLTIYADGSLSEREALVRRIEGRGLAQVIRVLPSVPASHLPRLLGAAGLLLLPREQGIFSESGFPNKLGEYFASGRPVVVTDIGDVSKYLVAGRDACIIPGGDIGGFVSAVDYLVQNPSYGDRMGARGQRTFAAIARNDLVMHRVLTWIYGLPLRNKSPLRLRRRPSWLRRAAGNWIRGHRRSRHGEAR